MVESSENWLETLSRMPFVMSMVTNLHEFLINIGLDREYFPTPASVCVALLLAIATPLIYFLFMGNIYLKRRRKLVEELQQAQKQLYYLREKLHKTKEDKEIRIFMDGAFDMLHYGHMNAFRLGRSLGTYLVVGVNSDESIKECKGPPLMNDEERLAMVQACKFVDEVVPECPYIMNQEYLEYVIEKYKIDYVVHGDDPCIVDGKDVYETAKKAGKFKSIPRTEGVSTTDIVGRMLLLTRSHHFFSNDASNRGQLLGQKSKFLTTSHMLRLFSAGVKAPTPASRVIYIDGAFDMFHCGHVAILKAAKERGDYLIVGIHGDQTVNRTRGHNLPLMNLHERVLSVLGCRHVDDILIDAPYEITGDMIKSLNISEVVRGSRSDDIGIDRSDETERYRYPKQEGIFSIIRSPSNFNLGSIVERIQKNHVTFQAKFERKMKAEKEFYKSKHEGQLSEKR